MPIQPLWSGFLGVWYALWLRIKLIYSHKKLSVFQAQKLIIFAIITGEVQHNSQLYSMPSLI